MKNSIIIKCSVFTLLLTGWISCGQSKDDPVELEEEADDGIKIENLETRLRFLDTRDYIRREAMWQCDLDDPVTHKHMWRWDPGNVIIHFPPSPERYMVDTHFGYADADGQVILCDVINFPEAALQWEADYLSAKEKRTEVNVLLSGTVRLYADENGKKYGTLELTSMEPSEAEPARLQLGVYTETCPARGDTYAQINFMDEEMLEITQIRDGKVYQTALWRYEIRDNDRLGFTRMEDAMEGSVFFRVISDSEFEREDMYVVTAENLPPVMTFKKGNRFNN